MIKKRLSFEICKSLKYIGENTIDHWMNCNHVEFVYP